MCIFVIKQVISPWVPKRLFVKMTTQLKMICRNHGYFGIILKIWHENITLESNLCYTYKINANSTINIYVHRPTINPNPKSSKIFDAKLPLWMIHVDFQLPGYQINFLNLIKCKTPYNAKFCVDFKNSSGNGWWPLTFFTNLDFRNGKYFFLKFAFFTRENTNPSSKSGTGTKNHWIITEKVI